MRLLYFAWLREKAGINSEEVNPPSEVATVADLIEWLKARGGGHAEAFADPTIVRVAFKQEYANLSDSVAAGDEVAFFPPVTGGKMHF